MSDEKAVRCLLGYTLLSNRLPSALALEVRGWFELADVTALANLRRQTECHLVD